MLTLNKSFDTIVNKKEKGSKEDKEKTMNSTKSYQKSLGRTQIGINQS